MCKELNTTSPPPQSTNNKAGRSSKKQKKTKVLPKKSSNKLGRRRKPAAGLQNPCYRFYTKKVNNSNAMADCPDTLILLLHQPAWGL